MAKATAILAALVWFFIAAPQAQSGPYDFFADANTGNDANTCLSWAAACQSLQGAVNKIPVFSGGGVTARGVFITPANAIAVVIAAGKRDIYIAGMETVEAGCVDPLSFRIVSTVPHTHGVSAQDYITLALRCAYVHSTATGGAALHNRQFSILDTVDVVLDTRPMGSMISMTDTSMFSCGGVLAVRGNADVFAENTKRSGINLGCTVYVGNGLTFTRAFITGRGFSDTSATGMFVVCSDWIGTLGCVSQPPGEGPYTKQYDIINAELHRGPYTIPGTIPGTAGWGPLVQ